MKEQVYRMEDSAAVAAAADGQPLFVELTPTWLWHSLLLLVLSIIWLMHLSQPIWP